MLKVLEIALAEVGYMEKSSLKADLDDPGASPGYGNITKYARDLDALGDFYNGPKQGAPWCEVFVDWCMYKAYGEDMALKLLCQPRKSAGAGCTQSAQYYKAAGRFYTAPHVGDQIFFTYGNGDVDHTGLVWKVNDNVVYTVEGNTSGTTGLEANGGAVCKKSYLRTSSYIYGYGRPNYSLVEKEDPTFTVNLSPLKRGDSGRQVEALQKLLKGTPGSTIVNCDGKFGPKTKSSLGAWQKANGLKVTYTMNEECWKKILGAL